MSKDFELQPVEMQRLQTMKALAECNELTKPFGLSLDMKQMQTLTEHRFAMLRNTNRVEFGEGIIKKLIYAFCDSPYIAQDNYEETLLELQEMFYYFKGESMEALSDDELIEAMKECFNGEAQGSLEYLSGTFLEDLCQSVRKG